MRTLSLFSIGLCIAWSLPLGANVHVNCKAIRLDEPGKSFEKIPVVNQGDVPYCASDTAAQIVDAYRFSHGDTNFNHFTSGIQLGLPLVGSNLAEGVPGSVSGSVNNAKKMGSCNAGKIDQIKNGRSRSQFLDDYETYLDLNSEYLRSLGIGESLLGAVGFGYRESPAVDKFKCDIEKGLGAGSFEDLRLVINTVLESNTYEYGKKLARVIKEACKDSTIDMSYLPEPEDVDFTDQYNHKGLAMMQVEEVESRISSSLNRENAQPVAVSYCTNMFLNGFEGMGGCKAHASVIIGQRQGSDGGCQYLLRNSKGAGWCPPQSRMTQYNLDCEKGKGQVWIDAELLSLNTFNLYSLPP